MNDSKTLVIDLDGTICTQMESGKYGSAEPVLDVIKKINMLWTEGWNIVIFTARGMNTCAGDVHSCEQLYRVMTEEWLLQNRVCYNKLIFGKPSADIYVDDKGMSINEFTHRNFK